MRTGRLKSVLRYLKYIRRLKVKQKCFAELVTFAWQVAFSVYLLVYGAIGPGQGCTAVDQKAKLHSMKVNAEFK